MINMLSFFRYLVFGLFVISNSIICTLAVWNLTLAQSAGQNLQVDIYLIFLGAFALVFIFTVIFTEILRKNAITGRLWFEASWVGLFWIMELSGAAALTAIVPNILCDRQSKLIVNTACSSTQALLAFSWIITATLLVYLVFLLCAIIIRQQQDPQIWHASVREFCRCPSSRQSLGSVPASPRLPHFRKELPDVVAPQPRRPPPTAIYAHHSGLGPKYDNAQYRRPSSPTVARPALPIPTPAPHLLTRASAMQSTVPAPSLYPLHLHSSMPRPQPLKPSPASPPPLGNWPRADAVEQPLRSARRASKTTTTYPASSASKPDPPSERVASALVSSRSRPTGPRTTSGSREIRRPPPLNLTKISTFSSSGSR